MRNLLKVVVLGALVGFSSGLARADWQMQVSTSPAPIIVPSTQGGACSVIVRYTGLVSHALTSFRVWTGTTVNGPGTTVASGGSVTLSCGASPFAAYQVIGWIETNSPGTFSFDLVTNITPGAGGLADPGANGIVKRTAQGVTTVASAADIAALFSGSTPCYLKSDGTCSTPSSMVWPSSAGIQSWVTGTAWGTAYATSGTGTTLCLTVACAMSTPTLSSPSLGAGVSPITETYTVGTGGVTQNTLVITDSSNPSLIVAGNGSGAYGVAMSSGSATTTVEIARYGTVGVLTDTGGATAGDLCIPGTGTVTYCKDSGQTASSAIPFTTRIVGVFRTTATAGNAAQVELTPAHYGTGSIVKTDLSNLSAVAINTSLLPGTTASIDLGNASFQWRNAYIGSVVVSGHGPWAALTERANNITPAAGFDYADTDSTSHCIEASFNGDTASCFARSVNKAGFSIGSADTGSPTLTYAANAVNVGPSGTTLSPVSGATINANQVNGATVPASVGAGALGTNSSGQLVNNAGAAYYGSAYGMVSGYVFSDGSWTNTQANLTSAGQMTFTSGMVGWTIFGSPGNACVSGTTQQMTGKPTIIGTISSITSAHVVVVSANATGTVASGGCVAVGPLNDTAISSLETAFDASPVCPTVVLPQGYFLVAASHLTSQPTACVNNVMATTAGGFNYGRGIHIVGQGQGATWLIPTPGFVFTCTGGLSGEACFGGQQEMFWAGITINGMGQSLTGAATGTVNMFECNAYSVIENSSFDSWGASTSSTSLNSGIYASNSNDACHIQNTTVDAFGYIQLRIVGASRVIAYDSFFQDSAGSSGNRVIWIDSSTGLLKMYGGGICPGSSSPANAILVDNSGTALLDSVFFFENAAANAAIGVKAESGSFTTMVNNTLTLNTNSSVAFYQPGGTTYLTNNVFTGTAGGFALQQTAGVMNDLGGNTFSGSITFTGLFGDASITNTVAAASNVNLNSTATTGWGVAAGAGTGVSAVTGATKFEGFTATAAGAPSISPTITVTFPLQFWTTPVCSISLVGGTGTGITAPLLPTSISATAVTWTFTGTAVASMTYIFQQTCKNPNN